MTRPLRLFVLIAALATLLLGATSPAAVLATAPPAPSPPVTNDLLPGNNSLNNCIGTVEQANCGSRARADGHTYLVFLALAGGLAFIGWRVARGVRARDESQRRTT